MIKKCAKALIWGMLAVSCIVLLSEQSYAQGQAAVIDESNISENLVIGRDGGPGVCIDEKGEIVAADLSDSSLSSDADTQDTQGETEPASALADDNKNLESSALTEEKAPEVRTNIAQGEADDKVYELDGVKYVKGDYYGTHKLTGYSGEEWGTQTASGESAEQWHTVSATSQLPFGTVIIIDGGSGPSIDNYSGIYVVEDRGGSAVENDGVIDLFFNSHADASMVTHYGWNHAEVWIAVPV